MSKLTSVVLVAAVLMTALLIALVVAGAAEASYGAGATGLGAELVSADFDRLEQGDDSTVYVTLSADGTYAFIQTRARNFFPDDDADPVGKYRAGGIFRFDLDTQGLEKVADGDLFDESTNNFLRRGASNPSSSADGRYVAFVTAEPIIPADTNDNADVYVRDMNVDEDQPGAFDLVSARDGGDVPASYGPAQVPSPGTNPGSDLSRGAAISADGRYVVFRTDVATDLPARGAVDTPGRQIFVRDRTQNKTILMTRTDPAGDPAGGGLGSAISADGTTVVWTGFNAPVQTEFLPGESTDETFNYYLWRRFADGPSAPTRRITGVSDPDDPNCPPGEFHNYDAITEGPCFGPITEQEGLRSGIISQVPALSADGYEVAFLTGSGPRPIAFKGAALDLYATDMHPGVTRKEGTTELTRAGTTTDAATTSPISGLAMSPDGRYLAITTSRTQFNLGTLTPTTTPRTVPGIRELYAIDLQLGTIERVARSYNGDDINGDVSALPAISDGGERIAFTSFAGNLFFGDANQRADAFVANFKEDLESSVPPPPPDPIPPEIIEPPRLQVKADSLGKGKVELHVHVPAAGGLKVIASGQAGKPRGRRSLAKGTARSAGNEVVDVQLRIVQRYRDELADRKHLRGRARLQFVYSLGGEQLTDSVPIIFKAKAGKSKKRGDG